MKLFYSNCKSDNNNTSYTNDTAIQENSNPDEIQYHDEIIDVYENDEHRDKFRNTIVNLASCISENYAIIFLNSSVKFYPIPAEIVEASKSGIGVELDPIEPKYLKAIYSRLRGFLRLLGENLLISKVDHYVSIIALTKDFTDEECILNINYASEGLSISKNVLIA